MLPIVGIPAESLSSLSLLIPDLRQHRDHAMIAAVLPCPTWRLKWTSCGSDVEYSPMTGSPCGLSCASITAAVSALPVIAWRERFRGCQRARYAVDEACSQWSLRILTTEGRMRYSTHPWTAVFATLLLVTATAPASAQTTGAAALRVGAARVDVTPSQGELPKNSRGILDRLYARAIVLESGTSSAASSRWIPERYRRRSGKAVTGRIEKELGIPTSNVLLTATHTHSAGGQRGVRTTSRR